MKIPRHSTVAAYAALFVALGGTSYAAATLPANSVTSGQIKNGSVHYADLAADARPAKSNGRFRQAVADVVADPATQVSIHVVGEKGDKGDQGSNGATVQGPQGPSGSSGSTGATGANGASGSPGPAGPPGGAAAFGTIHVTNSDSQTFTTNTQGATVTHPGLGIWCMSGSGLTAIAAVPESPNTEASVFSPTDSRNTCASGRWQVLMSNGSGQDTGFSFVGN